MADQLGTGITNARAYEEERQRAEALAELDRAKTVFFSNVSHEFRTPLTLLVGPLEESLADQTTPLPAVHRERQQVAHRNALRLLRLVNTLLDFSRIEAGRIDATYEPTDLAGLTADLASVFRSAIETAGLRLVVHCDPLPSPVYVDRGMWETIVLNLLSNALKFTFDGQIAIALRADGNRVELKVSDTGVGIPEADLPRMFERFHRVKHARARTFEGTGIGLALVHELVRLHGGEITVASGEGRGTTFTVILRTGSAHLPSERVSAARPHVPASVGATPFVEEALRWLPADSATLETEPIPVSSAAGAASNEHRALGARRRRQRGHAAVSRAGFWDRAIASSSSATAAPRWIESSERMPDLVLADVMMPTLDGFGLLAAVRADERTRSLPVILLSARAGEEARIEGLHAGADEYLVKPFSARELLACVASQLQLARVRQETERALRQRSEQYQTLLNQAPLGVYVVDADFRIREVNPVAAPLFENVPGGAIGRDRRRRHAHALGEACRRRGHSALPAHPGDR